MLPEAVALGAETRNLRFGTLQGGGICDQLPLVATTGSTKAPSFVAKEDNSGRRETVLASGGGAGLTRQLPGSGQQRRSDAAAEVEVALRMGPDDRTYEYGGRPELVRVGCSRVDD